MFPRGREIILGIGGGISAYKSCELLRRLQDSGYLVTVIPTRNSLNFVGKATWEALSGREVFEDLWSNVHHVPHISLAHKGDAIVIAPATADLIARIATGRSDDLLTSIVLSSTAPLILVPAMHTEMWLNPATVHNVALLKERGVHIIEPEHGRMTGNDVGVGRYPEIPVIIDEVNKILSNQADLRGIRILISAGGTREAIDPVRYIGNSSSGIQGYSIAHAAVSRGAAVTVVSANVSLPDIEGARTIKVSSALHMNDAMVAEFPNTEICFMTAAVADVRPKEPSHEKVAKDSLHSIELQTNPDILQALVASKTGQIIVGFAAQTGVDGLDLARSKFSRKGVDLLYFNDVSAGAIFGSEMTEGTIFDKEAAEITIPATSKLALAHTLLDMALGKLKLDHG
jgi:phosphopantothenoylcysteine decarboxylase / phosphopantothenate---cysteine ligase